MGYFVLSNMLGVSTLMFHFMGFVVGFLLGFMVKEKAPASKNICDYISNA